MLQTRRAILASGQILSTIDVSPSTATLLSAGTQAYTATGNDRNGRAMNINPSWSTQAAPLASLTVYPSPSSVNLGATRQFSAVGLDAYGGIVSVAPVWSVTGGGSINSSTGLYTAPGSGATLTVTATVGSITATSTVTVAGAIVPEKLSFSAIVPTGGAAIGSDSAVSLATARAGGTLTLYSGSATTCFLADVSGGNNTVRQSFIEFDTAFLSGVTIDSVILTMYATASLATVTDTIECRLYDWGTSLTTADWVADSGLAALTLLGSKVMDGIVISSGLALPFTDIAFAANINKAGKTRVILHSARTRTGGAASGMDFNLGSPAQAILKPLLTVSYH